MLEDGDGEGKRKGPESERGMELKRPNAQNHINRGHQAEGKKEKKTKAKRIAYDVE